MDYFPIINLPAELKRRTACYLSPYDALRLSETCKNLHVSLSLRLLRDSRQLFIRQRFMPNATNGDGVFPWIRIPCLSRRVHSITVTFRWRDQGWGNRKGQVFIVGSPRLAQPDPSLPFHGGRVVCASPQAPHQEEECKLTFLTSSMEGETYQMWYRVGGGGGHQLQLMDGKLHTVIFDDEAGNFSRNYKILKDVGAIAVHPEAELPRTHSSFYPQLLLRVSMSIRLELALAAKRNKRKSRGRNEDIRVDVFANNPLVSFFQMFHIEVSEDSLSAVEEIIQCESDEQASTQNTSVAPADPEQARGGGGFLDDFRELLMGVGMEFFPADQRVLRLNMQPMRAEIEVQQIMIHDDDNMSDDTTDGDDSMNSDGDQREAASI